MANLIIPEVLADVATESFDSKIRISRLATHSDILLNTNVGDTVRFPMFNRIGEAKEIGDSEAVVPERLNQTDSEAKIKLISSAVRVPDMDDMIAAGSFIKNGAVQIGESLARKLDMDLALEARKSPLKVTSPYEMYITSVELAEAMNLFGDSLDASEFSTGGILVHSATVQNLYSWNDFVNIDLTHTTGGNGIIRDDGLVGFWRGIPIYCSNHGTYDPVNQQIVSYIIKNDALSIIRKRNIAIASEREEKIFATDLVGSFIYAVKQTNEEGVVVIAKTHA